MEKIIISGVLGADVKIVDTNGRRFASFNVACNRHYKDTAGNIREVTNWYRCSYNKPDSLFLKHLIKGVRVFIAGRPSYSIYDSEKAHAKVVGVDIMVDDLDVGVFQQIDQGNVQAAAKPVDEMTEAEKNASGIPF